MGADNVVTIFEVLDDGSTGGRIATGTLVHPVLVLVHQSYAARLQSDPPLLRVGLAATSPAGPPTVEVIEARTVHPFTVDDGDPLLALELDRAAEIGAVVLPPADEPLRAELRRLAAGDVAVDARPIRPSDPGGPPGSSDHPICRIFPWICRPIDAGADGDR